MRFIEKAALALAALPLCLMLAATPAMAQAKKPNIVVIMGDDIGM